MYRYFVTSMCISDGTENYCNNYYKIPVNMTEPTQRVQPFLHSESRVSLDELRVVLSQALCFLATPSILSRCLCITVLYPLNHRLINCSSVLCLYRCILLNHTGLIIRYVKKNRAYVISFLLHSQQPRESGELFFFSTQIFLCFVQMAGIK